MCAQEGKGTLMKNSIALYLRMMLSIGIGLYTSRIVLETLGVDDYGVYNITGGIVGLTGFINASMSAASSRFLTYELGKANIERLKKTFAASLTIHIAIAILVLLLCETVGLWFVNYKLNLPHHSIEAANWVFQMSILSTCFTIIQVPYNASIIAHEKMNIYAYIEILSSILKLIIVCILIEIPLNKLELYSSLLAIASMVIFSIYVIYGKNNFHECQFRIETEKSYLKPMLSYSGWDLFGNLSVTAKQQGGSIVLNLFYGVVANASAGIANIVNGTILGFSQVVMTAFRPRIIKYYAYGSIDKFLQLMHISFKITLIFYAVISIPAYICMDGMLKIWLVSPPNYSALFCRILLISGFFNLYSLVFITGIHATGKIKAMSLLGLCCNFMTLISSYLGYRLGADIGWLYYCFCAFNATSALGCMILLKKQVHQLNIRQFITDSAKVLGCYCIIFGGSYLGHNLVTNNWGNICITVSFAIVLTGISTWCILLNKVQRKNCSIQISRKLKLGRTYDS